MTGALSSQRVGETFLTHTRLFPFVKPVSLPRVRSMTPFFRRTCTGALEPLQNLSERQRHGRSLFSRPVAALSCCHGNGRGGPAQTGARWPSGRVAEAQGRCAPPRGVDLGRVLPVDGQVGAGKGRSRRASLKSSRPLSTSRST